MGRELVAVLGVMDCNVEGLVDGITGGTSFVVNVVGWVGGGELAVGMGTRIVGRKFVRDCIGTIGCDGIIIVDVVC